MFVKIASDYCFYTPEETPAVLRITDAAGRTLLVRQLDAVAGYNQLTITKANLNGVTGTVNYTLQAGSFVATRSMIVVR